LGDSNITLNFGVSGVSGQSLPQIQVAFLSQSKAREDKTGLSRWPSLPSLSVRLASPLRLVIQEWIQTVWQPICRKSLTLGLKAMKGERPWIA
jgi:hypothetical protein